MEKGRKEDFNLIIKIFTLFGIIFGILGLGVTTFLPSFKDAAIGLIFGYIIVLNLFVLYLVSIKQ
ncbi:MAG: hypothetical protein KAT49_05115 [Methanomicrobia archaeon]|nr:hypothetical protein [Methanomicrobia archaeon]